MLRVECPGRALLPSWRAFGFGVFTEDNEANEGGSGAGAVNWVRASFSSLPFVKRIGGGLCRASQSPWSRD